MTEYPGGGDRPEQDQPNWSTPPSGSQPTPEPEQPGSWPFDDRDRGQPATPSPSPWSQPTFGEYQQPYSYTPPPQQPPPPYGYAQSEPHRPRRRGTLAATAVVVAAVVGGGAGAAIEHHWGDNSKTVVSSLANPPAKNTAAQKAPDGSVQKVAARLLPSVVSVTVAQGNGSGDEGTGIILTSDGEIMTNNHVVAAAAGGQGSISVTFNDGKTVQASILGRDTITDLAVIKAQNVSGAQPAQLGSSGALRVGQPVVAIGSPLGLSGTVTTGIVSALNRPVATSDSDGGGGQDPNAPGGGTSAQATVIDAIQTDAAINPGNSGGALVNMNGQVVGINQSIASVPGADTSSQSGSIGLGFAIPIDEARPVITQLIKSGKATHAQIGVKVTTAANSSGVTTGAKLVSVASGEGGAKAGLKAGDVVTKLDSRAIDSDDALIAAVRSHRPGDTVTLTYTRNGSTHTTRVTLGSDS